MKSVLKKLHKKAGYISLETVIVAGLFIGLGVYAISLFYDNGREITFASVDRVMESMDILVDGTPIL